MVSASLMGIFLLLFLSLPRSPVWLSACGLDSSQRSRGPRIPSRSSLPLPAPAPAAPEPKPREKETLLLLGFQRGREEPCWDFKTCPGKWLVQKSSDSAPERRPWRGPARRHGCLPGRGNPRGKVGGRASVGEEFGEVSCFKSLLTSPTSLFTTGCTFWRPPLFFSVLFCWFLFSL